MLVFGVQINCNSFVELQPGLYTIHEDKQLEVFDHFDVNANKISTVKAEMLIEIVETRDDPYQVWGKIRLGGWVQMITADGDVNVIQSDLRSLKVILS
jgi:hypothetical protein